MRSLLILLGSAADGEGSIGNLFGAQVIDDGAAMIQLEVPHFVTREAEVAVSIQVNWQLILSKAVARLYLVADGNREPVLACIALIPDVVPPHMCIKIRLDDTREVRAVVEGGDGTLLQAKRRVWVMLPESEATSRV